ncbi:non-ribosomal peptide synthetase [Chitinophaga solisilvae]|uniref:non-ribosomal peptide synthetase n=1 Tax=Chitinophaga solisilvae TaxID=1233460 RepID=UPI00136C3E7F|nr:non-ribosomal peptide synthetase [Chitinophaga solisilvae]
MENRTVQDIICGMSLPQQDIYYEHLLVNDPVKFNIGAKVVINGTLDEDRLRKSLDILIQRNEALRMSVLTVDGNPAVKIHPVVNGTLGFISMEQEPDPEAAAGALIDDEFRKGFELDPEQLLYRFTLLKISAVKYFLVARYHHIIVDGWATSLMYQQWTTIYNTLLTGEDTGRQQLFRYTDYIRESTAYPASAAYQADSAYWEQYFSNPGTPVFEPDEQHLHLQPAENFRNNSFLADRKEYDAIVKWCEQQKCSIFHFFIAVISKYAAGLSGRKDLVVGLPILNRSDFAAKHTIGLYTMITPLRIRDTDSMDLSALMQQLKADLKASYRHQKFPLRGIMKQEGAIADLGRTIYDVFFSYEKHDYDFAYGESGCQVIPLVNANHRCPVCVYVREFDAAGPVKIDISLDTAYFPEEVLALATSHLHGLMQKLAAQTTTPLKDISLLAAWEEARLLQWGKGEEVVMPAGGLTDWLRAAADASPQAIAVRAADADITYAALKSYTAAISNYLQQHIIQGENNIIAVLPARDSHLLPVMSGIMDAGAAYLPLDSKMPVERIRIMLDDSGAVALLASRKYTALIPPACKGQVIFIEDLQALAAACTKREAVSAAAADRLAYIIYTSGSTGKPKGVEIGYRSLGYFLTALRQMQFLGKGDVLLAHTSVAFDISILELFFPLIQGGMIVLADDEVATDPLRLKELYYAEQVNVMQATPSMWALLYEAGWKGSSGLTILTGGEALPQHLAVNLAGCAKAVWNMYGPTETTIWSAAGLITDAAHIHIGRPIANTQCYIMKGETLAPAGCRGELVIGGEGVARGYKGQPGLTAERFVPDPYRPGAWRYRTGDLCSWNPDGTLAYHRRNDSQVKLHGHRIECAGIEQIMMNIPYISRAYVDVIQLSASGKALVAFISSDITVEEKNIREILEQQLPAYMVPSVFIAVAAWPLMVSGKTDKQQLTALYRNSLQEEVTTALPLSEREQEILTIWQEVLETRQAGMDDSFFRYGGDSLKAIRLQTRLYEKFGVRTGIRYIFSHPTPRLLCQGLQHTLHDPAEKILPAGGGPYYPLSGAQQRIWLMSQTTAGSLAYTMREAFHLKGAIDFNVLEAALSMLAERTPSLRTAFIQREGGYFQQIIPHTSAAACIEIIPVNAAATWIEEKAAEPFDLSRVPLLKVQVQSPAAGEHIFLLSVHHLVADGLSLKILVNRLFDLYRDIAAGKKTAADDSGIDYKDYAVWYQQWLQRGIPETVAAFWRRQLNGAPAALQLPGMNTQHHTGGGAGGRGLMTFTVPGKHTAGISNFSAQHHTTAFAVYLSVYTLVLSKISGNKDFITGIVTAGRDHPQLQALVGNFINFLPFRVQPAEDLSLSDYIAQVAAKLQETDQYKDFPAEMLAEEWTAAGHYGQPLYNTAMVFHTDNTLAQLKQHARCQGWRLSPLALQTGVATLDIKLDVLMHHRGRKTVVRLEYNPDKVPQELATRLRDGLQHAFGWLDQPATLISALQLPADKLYTAKKKTTERLQVLASFSAEPLLKSLEACTAAMGIRMDISLAPYNQYLQYLAASLSEKDQLTVLLFRPEDVLRQSPAGGIATVTAICNSITALLAALPPGAVCMVGICPAGENDMLAGQRSRFYTRIQELAAQHAGIKLLQLEQLGKYYPVSETFDRFADRQAHIPYTENFFTALAMEVARKIFSRIHPTFKVIAVDCDNTLWTGVCGEDGATGVRIGSGNRLLQEFLLKKREEGFLLAIVSKNNEQDVWDVFDHHPDMLLKKAAFTTWKINWERKSQNIAAIAAALGFREDAVLLLDDSLTECMEVKTANPDICALPVPLSAAEMPAFLYHLTGTEAWSVTEEDRSRPLLYEQQQAREQSLAVASSMEAFLQKLDLKVSLNNTLPQEADRISQLSLRTNQFNLSGQRFTAAEITTLAADGTPCFSIEARDVFGDYGLVGAVIAGIQEEALVVTSFLLSCRALGKGVETAVLSGLKQYAEQQQLPLIRYCFRRLPRNKPIQEFLEKYATLQSREGDITYYEIAVADIRETAYVTLLRGERFPPAVAPAAPQQWQPLQETPPAEMESSAAYIPDSAYFNAITPADKHYRVYKHFIEVQDRSSPLWDSNGAGNALSQHSGDQLFQELHMLYSRFVAQDPADPAADYFRLGGDSIKATRLLSAVYRQFGKEVSLAAFFARPTLYALYDIVREKDVTEAHQVSTDQASVTVELSDAQQQIWMLAGMRGGNAAYNQAAVITLRGTFDIGRLRDGFQWLTDRYEILRTGMVAAADSLFPLQQILPAGTHRFEIERIDVSRCTKEDITEMTIRESRREFDLSQAPLLRAVLLESSSSDSILICCTHHIVAEGWSLQLIVEKLIRHYSGEAETAWPQVQYRDWVKFRQEHRHSAAYLQAKDYWLQLFGNGAVATTLPFMLPHKGHPGFSGKTYSLRLPMDTADLKDRCAQAGVTPFIWLLTTVKILLAHLAATQEVIVGTISAGRGGHYAFFDQVGLFTQSLLLKTDIPADRSFRELLEAVRTSVVKAYEHESYGYHDLTGELRRQKIAQVPAMNIMVIMDEFSVHHIQVNDALGLTIEAADTCTSRFGLCFVCSTEGPQPLLKLIYNTAVFREQDINMIAAAYQEILQWLSAHPDQPVAGLTATASAGVNMDSVSFDF